MAEKIFQGGYMSGDTYSASAYLALNSEARIILLKDTKEPQDKTDSTVLKFYNECGLGDRVSLIDLSASSVKVKEVWQAFNNAPNRAPERLALGNPPASVASVLSALYYNYNPKNQWPRSIVSVTGLLANEFQSRPITSTRKVAELWKIGKFDTQTKFALWEFAGKRFAKTGFDIRQNIVALWSRQSGKKGGAHIELDSSYQGIRQLARYFCESKATVMLVGDERSGKLSELASESPQIVNVAEMWKDDFWKEHFAGVPVLAQLALFKFLAEDYNVIHVGMRSGMLETMALLRMPVFYMEPTASPSGSRMLAFGRCGISYSRIEIEAPPSTTAFGAQLSIRRGIPAPSLSHWDDQVSKKSQSIMRFGLFRDRYGRYVPRRGVVFSETGQKAARDFAKGELIGLKNMKDNIEDRTVIERLQRWRGFGDTDFENIVSRVEGAFRRT